MTLRAVGLRLLLVLMAALIAVVVCAPLYRLPPAHMDGALFLGVAANLAAGDGMVFSTFSTLFELNHGSWNYVFHGPLYPWLVALLAGSSDWAALLRALVLINVGTALAVTWALFRLLPAPERGTGHYLLIAASVLALSWVSQSLAGRPEHALTLLLALWCVARSHVRNTLQWLADGLMIGTAGALSPVPAALMALYLCVQGASTQPARIALTQLFGTAVVALGSYVIWLSISSPFSPVEIVYATLEQGIRNQASLPRNLRYVLNVWLFSPQFPLLALPWIAAMSVCAWRMRARGAQPGEWTLALGFTLLFALCLGKWVLLHSLSYNLMACALIVMPLLSGALQLRPIRVLLVAHVLASCAAAAAWSATATTPRLSCPELLDTARAELAIVHAEQPAGRHVAYLTFADPSVFYLDHHPWRLRSLGTDASEIHKVGALLVPKDAMDRALLWGPESETRAFPQFPPETRTRCPSPWTLVRPASS